MNWNLVRRNIVFYLVGNDKTDADPDKIIFATKDTNYMSLLLLCQQKTITNYQNVIAKYLKDRCVGMNIKQKVKIKMWQLSIDVFSNETL